MSFPFYFICRDTIQHQGRKVGRALAGLLSRERERERKRESGVSPSEKASRSKNFDPRNDRSFSVRSKEGKKERKKERRKERRVSCSKC